MTDVYVGNDGKLHKVKGGADSVLNFNKDYVIDFSIVGTCYNNDAGRSTTLSGGKIVIQNGKITSFVLPSSYFFNSNVSAKVQIGTFSIS